MSDVKALALYDNEGLYGEIAREMASGSSLLVPHLNGVPYLEKPLLLDWLTAAIYALFGSSATAMRAIPAAASSEQIARQFRTLFNGLL